MAYNRTAILRTIILLVAAINVAMSEENGNHIPNMESSI
jgi:hypothetical protein